VTILRGWISQSSRRGRLRRFFRVDEPVFLAVLAIPVGICSGLAAVGLNRGIETIWDLLHALRGQWYAPFLPAIGAAISVFVLAVVFREGVGHGVPVVIYSVSRKGGLLRLRSSVSHLLGSLATISFGGSAGPEAPIVVSGASIGSNIARVFRLNERRRVATVGCGVAGAISAIFNAPIAGIVFAVEIIIGEWTPVHLIPIGIASVTATQVSRLLEGNQIRFEHDPFQVTTLDIVACTGFAVFLTVVSVMLRWAIPHIERLSGRAAQKPWQRAAAGGLIVGLIGLFSTDVLGEGYRTVNVLIDEQNQPILVYALLLVLAKIAATSLTLGTGSAGGIFAPCLVIGSFAGVAYWQMLVHVWPHVGWVGSGCFALLGMAGMISGVMHAPLTGIFMIVEITGGYDVILPLILVSVLTVALCRLFHPASVYHQELIERGEFLRPRTDARLLADLHVMELIEKNVVAVRSDTPLRDFVDLIKPLDQIHFPVEDPETKKCIGIISVDRVRSYLLSPELYNAVLVEEIMDDVADPVSPRDSLIEVMERFDKSGLWVLPVMEAGKTLGIISKATVLNQYRTELKIQGSL